MKHFIITVDTEGDNLWEYHGDSPIHTNNTTALPRFQNLCNEFGYKPVYLTNYEMVEDENYVRFAKDTQGKGLCEIGLHIHAWNNPPLYNLPVDTTGQAYLIEYPEEIMRQKVEYTYNLIKEKIGVLPISHRAGRWAMDNRYFKIIRDLGIKVDCSYTPYINWENSIGASQGGCNYSDVSIYPQIINGILEVPMSIHKGKIIPISKKRMLKMLVRMQSLPRKISWLRPACSSLEDMKSVIDFISSKKNLDFAMFMIHSSELIPGGSPYFTSEEAVDELYDTMYNLFDYAHKQGFVGTTLKEYYEQKN